LVFIYGLDVNLGVNDKEKYFDMDVIDYDRKKEVKRPRPLPQS
jgi:hypothetical protein